MNWILYFLFNFVLYSFLGWVLEEVYCFVITGKFKEDRFLFGPFKPMYGFAMAILIFLYNYIEIKGVLLIVLLLIIPTAVEYISGLGLRKIIGKDYWNYKHKKYNFQGIICLKFSIYWAILSAFVIFIMQPLITDIYMNIEGIFTSITIFMIIYMVIDLIATLKIFVNKGIAKG